MKERMTKQEFLDWADDYLQKRLDESERLEFEDFCHTHPDYLSIFEDHKVFLEIFKNSEERKEFIAHLRQAENTYFKEEKTKSNNTPLVRFWSALSQYKVNIAVAASIALISAVCTLWFSGFYSAIKKSTSDYSALRRDMNTVKKNVNAQNVAINSIAKRNKDDEAPHHYGGTGFMLSTDGYVVTNLHVVMGADSIWLYGMNEEVFAARVVHADTSKDVAILYIDDESFYSPNRVPYTFNGENTDLGEDIYTIGFPKDDAVYGQGYLSSATGYQGDTLSYQISIPVNPGNSGGPVLDRRGNIIGMISGKQPGLEGSAFAIKAKALLNTLDEIPEGKLEKEIAINQTNTLSALNKTDRIKELQKYIYMVKVQ